MTAHRQIHLDFHTPAGVTVGDKFNAAEFFDTLETAKVGTRHPGLGFDLLGQMVAESTKRKMPVLAYFSLNVDEVFAEAHPEYVAQFRDGKPVDSQIQQSRSWKKKSPSRCRNSHR